MNKKSCLIFIKIIQDTYFNIFLIDEEIEAQELK